MWWCHRPTLCRDGSFILMYMIKSMRCLQKKALLCLSHERHHLCCLDPRSYPSWASCWFHEKGFFVFKAVCDVLICVLMASHRCFHPFNNHFYPVKSAGNWRSSRINTGAFKYMKALKNLEPFKPGSTKHCMLDHWVPLGLTDNKSFYSISSRSQQGAE